MSAERFTIDTNILVYALDSLAGAKQTTAIDILERAAHGNCVLTLQSLSEFYAAVTRKNKVMPEDAARQVYDWLDVFPTIAPTARAFSAAVSHASAGRFSLWDAILIETAADGNCSALITEDMADGVTVNGVLIVHPFADGRVSTGVEHLLG